MMASLLMFESAQTVQCTPAALVNFVNWISVEHTVFFLLWRLIKNICKLIHTFDHLWEILLFVLFFFFSLGGGCCCLIVPFGRFDFLNS